MRRPLLASAAVLALAACGNLSGPDGPPPLLSALPRELSPAELRIADGANAFAFDLLREATRSLAAESNAFLSPLSASMALGMALNGANGETFEAMRTTLRLDGMSQGEINQGYRDLVALLGGLDGRAEMRVANAMWAHRGLPLEPAFTAAGREFFDAEIATLDFGAPGAVETINRWVDGKTGGRIPRLLDQLAKDEVLFLVNAIYFKARWREAFESKDTRQGPFHGADGRDRTAFLMWQKETLRYGETEEYQAVDLLYGNGAFAMTVILPRLRHEPAGVLAGLDAAAWRDLVARFHDETVILTLPRFTLDYSRRLDADLQALGMAIAFDPGRADFYRIADVRPERLFISRVEQKTFVEVNEEGTEAAAATGVGVGVTSAPQEVHMVVDRPFLFAIRERFSGTVVFLGLMNAVGE